MDVVVLLTGAALLYLFPFTIAVLRSLEPHTFIRYLISKKDYGALEDLIRRAMNEGLVRQVEIAMWRLQQDAIAQLAQLHGDVPKAGHYADFTLRLGKYAATRKDPEGITIAMDFLTNMTMQCTNRIYRGAADVFNEAVVQLEQIAEEAFGA